MSARATNCATALLMVFCLANGKACLAEEKVINELGKNYAHDLGHRIHVIFSGFPTEFRKEFIEADVEGLIDDIAEPTTLNEADLAIIYLSDTNDFARSPFYPDLEPIEDELIDGISSPSFEVGLTVNGRNGPRPLRLYFFNETAMKRDVDAGGQLRDGMDRSDLRCLAKRIYALSIFNDAKSVLSKNSGECTFYK